MLASTERFEPQWDRLHHFCTPTLPHLLALLAHPSESFPPADASLIVIDTISSLFTQAFPRRLDDSSKTSAPMKRNVQWASGRRWAVMNDIVTKIGKLAATRNIAILLASQMTTKIRSDTGASLYPATSGATWDNAIGNRLVIFRDWLSNNQNINKRQQDVDVRFVGVLKAKGVPQGVDKLAAFRVNKVNTIFMTKWNALTDEGGLA